MWLRYRTTMCFLQISETDRFIYPVMISEDLQASPRENIPVYLTVEGTEWNGEEIEGS